MITLFGRPAGRRAAHRINLRPQFAVAAGLLFALAGFAAMMGAQFGSATKNALAVPAPVAPALPALRYVCSFANDDAREVLVQGADGGQSVVVGDKTYWLFGDTVFLPQSGKQIEQNAIASSSALHDDGCPKLTYYAPDGMAMPFVPKDRSLTVWAAGATALNDHSFDVYTTYVYGSGPYAYWIGEIGVARVDTTSMQVSVVARRLWDKNSGFRSQVVGAQPIDVDDDGYLRVALATQSGEHLLARVRGEALATARTDTGTVRIGQLNPRPR